MARDYAQVWLTIWNDPDFQTRTADGQWLYFTLLTHPLLTACGVAPWREPKLVKMAAGMTDARLRAAAWDLGEVGLIAVDADTEEVLVRSFVRHDGVLKSPNMTKGLVREHGAIASLMIKALVSREVRRAAREHEDWKGLTMAGPVMKQFPEADEETFTMVPKWFSEGFPNGSDRVPEGFEKGSESVPSEIPPKQGNPSDLVPLSLNPQPSTPGTVVPGTAAGAAAPRRKPERPIPDDWAPTETHTAWADERGIDVIAEAERFRDWHQAHDSRMRDWDAAFRTWLRRAKPTPAARPARAEPRSEWDTIPTVAELRARHEADLAADGAR